MKDNSDHKAINVAVSNVQKRDDSFDVLRGVAIIAVIAIHAAAMDIVRIDIQHGTTCPWFFLMVRQCYNFAVPSFLFVSGYFIGKRSQTNDENYMVFLRRRLELVMVPYFVWSIGLLAYGAFRTGQFSIVAWLKLLGTGQVMGYFYFPLLIAQFYTMTFIIRRFVLSSNYGFLLMLLLNGAYLSLLYFLRYSFDSEPNPAITALPFLSWLGFFSFGLLVGGRSSVTRWLEQRVWLWLGLSVAGIFMSCSEAIITINRFNQVGWAASALKFSSFFYSFAFLSAFMGIRSISIMLPSNRMLTFAGRNSYAIFLSHGIFLDKIHQALYRVGLAALPQPVVHIILVAITTTACLAFAAIARGACGKRLSCVLIGQG